MYTSDCHSAELLPQVSNEGTGYNVCSECMKPCDVMTNMTASSTCCYHDNQIACHLPVLKMFGFWFGKEYHTICCECGEFDVPFLNAIKE